MMALDGQVYIACNLIILNLTITQRKPGMALDVECSQN